MQFVLVQKKKKGGKTRKKLNRRVMSNLKPQTAPKLFVTILHHHVLLYSIYANTDIISFFKLECHLGHYRFHPTFKHCLYATPSFALEDILFKLLAYRPTNIISTTQFFDDNFEWCMQPSATFLHVDTEYVKDDHVIKTG